MFETNLSKKTVLVTAAGREPGRSICLALCKNRAKVIACDEDLQAAKSTAQILKNLGGQAAYYQFNVNKKQELYRLAETIILEHGEIDILVNSEKDTLKESERKLTHEMHMDRYFAVYDRELEGLYFTSKAFLRHMVKNKGGIVINITSVLGLVPKKGMIANAAMAAATMSLSRVWALELDKDNVRVHCIARGCLPEEDALNEQEIIHQSIKRQITSEDVANAVLYCASDEAQAENGGILTVDGGLHYGYMRNF